MEKELGKFKYWLKIHGIDYRIFGMGCKQKAIKIKSNRN